MQRPTSARPYWLSAPNYYVLSIAVAVAAFVLVMGLLRDEYDEAYIPAGIAASSVMICAVVIRLAIFKKYKARAYAARRLDHNLNLRRLLGSESQKKLTIEQNASILRELKRKSDAASVLARHADGHREVFELCGQYLELNAREMLTVNPGSPRIAALRRGREIAEDYHHRHMLIWAEIETTALFDRAQTSTKNADKISLADAALAVIETAARKYPTEIRLLESASAIAEFVLKIKVSDRVERAGRAEVRGNLKLAMKHLQTALRELERNNVLSSDRDLAEKKIKAELGRLSSSE